MKLKLPSNLPLFKSCKLSKLYLTLFVLTFAAIGSYFIFSSHAATLPIPQTNTPPTIDGTLSESQWNVTTPITKLVSGTTTDTASWGALWDSNYLYVGVKVMDSSLNNGNANIYDNDSVEVYIDPNADGGTTYDANDKQITQGWNNPNLGGVSAATPGVLHAWANITGGYSIEMAIPWSSLGTTPAVNNPINLDIGINDSTGAAARTGQLMWNGTANNWQDPSGFGSFTLAGLPVGGIGDINNSGTVDITDLSLLLSSYGSNSSACVTAPQYTCSLSGTLPVGIVDLSILLSHFGQVITSPPTANLSASPTSITSGQSSTLTYSDTNSTSCTASANPADSNWTGSKLVTAGNHTQTVTPTQTTTYSLSCTGSGGTVNATPAVVTVSSGGGNVKPTIVGHQLNLGSTGTRLKMHGVAVWGVEDGITGSFGVNEYNDRQTIVNTVKSWGGNEIRLRLLASDYNNQTYMSKAQEIQEVKDWQSTAQAAGLYIGITWWDSLDGPYNDGNWANDYSQAFPMMNDVVSALGATNPWVFYEPFNEPNNVSEGSWLTAMRATVNNFRADGYTGILLLDTDGWSHVYNDADMSNLESYDNGLAGMGGKNQLIFAKHDYANEYSDGGSGFDSSIWPNNNDGSSTWNFSAHLAWETEFGNYNGSPSSVSYPWSQGAATWFAQKVNDGTLAGATGFLFGPWYDANAMTGSDDVTPTQWGGYVKSNFLANSQ